MRDVSDLNFVYLKGFSQFILDQKLDEVAGNCIQLINDYQFPLAFIGISKEKSKEDVLKTVKKQTQLILKQLLNGSALSLNLGSLPGIEQNNRSNLYKGDIKILIVLFGKIVKQSLLKLIPSFATEPQYITEVSIELESIFLQTEKQILSKNRSDITNIEHDFLSSILHNSLDGIFAVDLHLNIIAWNDALEIWGFGNKQYVIGKKIYEVITEFGDQAEIDTFSKVLLGEKKLIIDKRFYGTDGWFDANLAPLQNAKGEITGALGIIHETTETKNNENKLKDFQEELQASNEELQLQQRELAATNIKLIAKIDELENVRQVLTETNESLLEAQQIAQLGFWEWDVQKDIAYWSEEMFGLLRYSANERINVSLDLYLAHTVPEDREWIKNTITGAMVSFQSYSYEQRMVRKDGYTIWVRMSGRPYKDYLGNISKIKGTAFDITNEKNAYNKLAESEWKLRQSQHLAHLGNWEVNFLENNRIYCSEELYHIFGFEENSEIYLETINSLVLDEDKPKIKKSVDEAKTEEKPYKLQFRIRRADDGQIRHVYSKGVSEKDESGNVVRIKGFTQDITARKKIEKELTEKQYLIEKITENFPDHITVFDLISKEIVYSNKELLETLLYPPHFIEKFKEKGAIGYIELLHPDDLTLFYELYEYFTTNKDPSLKDVEFRLRDSQSEYHWIRARYNVFKRSHEGFAVQVIGVMRDESVKKKAELKSLESQHFIEKVTNSAPLIIYVVDITTRNITFINEQVVPILGYGVEELEVMYKNMLEVLVHPDDRNSLVLHIEDLKRISDGEVLHSEYRLKHINGTWRWFRGVDTIFKRDDSGAVVQIIGNIKDVTREKNTEENLKNAYADLKRTFRELVKTEKQLLKLNNELEERVKLRTNELQINSAQLKCKNDELLRMNEYMDNFVYAAAHDLKSPVANLKLLTDMIKKPEMAHNREIFIDAMSPLVNRLDHTLKGLVQIIEVQNDKSQPASFVSFSDILGKVKEEFPNEIEKAQPVFNIDFDKKPQIFYPEPFLLSILRNMVSNSLKYRSSRRLLKVSIRTRVSNGFTLIVYKDNGIGIDLKKFRKTIFHPFRRFSEQAEGTGIGLHLVKSMIIKNGGKIEVSSEPNRGTVFNIYLVEYKEDEFLKPIE